MPETGEEDIVALAEAREEAARACFIEHDADGSGALDAGELTSVLKALGLKRPGSSEEEFKMVVERCLKESDTNGDGLLQFDEFKTLFNAVRQSQDAAPSAEVSLVPHRYWRVLILGSAASGWEAYAKTLDLFPAGSDEPLRGGAAMCKPLEKTFANRNPAMAFDGDVGTMWRTQGDSGNQADWIGYDCGEGEAPEAVERVRMVQWGEDCNAMTRLALEWSDDGNSWTPRFVTGRVPCDVYDSAEDEHKLTGARALAAAAASAAHESDHLGKRFETLAHIVAEAQSQPHRYWRVLILGSAASGWEAYAKTLDLFPAGSDDPLRGGAAMCKALEKTFANRNPAMAFDGDVGTMWRTQGDSGNQADWIGYDCGEGEAPEAVERVRMVQWGEDCNAMTRLALEWSDDGNSWTPRFVTGRVPCDVYDSAEDEHKLTGARALAAAAASAAHESDHLGKRLAVLTSGGDGGAELDPEAADDDAYYSDDELLTEASAVLLEEPGADESFARAASTLDARVQANLFRGMVTVAGPSIHTTCNP